MINNIPGNLRQFFSKLNLPEEEMIIYWLLVQHGNSTTLELARVTGISRTQVYRFLEKMKKEGLVEEIIDEYRLLAKAVDIDQLERLVKEKEYDTKELRSLFPDVRKLLSLGIGQNQPGTKVLFYKGRDGLRQMLWNTLKAKEVVRGYSYRMVEDSIGEKFALEWAHEWVNRKLSGKDIISDDYIQNRKESKRPNHLDIVGFTFRSRYLPPNILKIDHQMDVYNNIVSYYSWHEGDVFGVEIYNQKVADFEKQVFEIVWKQAKPITLD